MNRLQFFASKPETRATCVALLALLPSIGCHVIPGSGDVVTIQRELTHVEHVDVCCGWRVDIVETDDAFVRITGDDNIISHIDIDHDGDRLELSFDDNHRFHPTRRIDVKIGVQRLESFSGSGGVELNTSPLSTKSLELELSGGSDAFLGGVDLLSLEVRASGGSEIDLAGASESIALDISGGSALMASGLETERATLALSGGSFATLFVRDALSVDASGGSEVVFGGSPKLDLDLSGGSSVEPR